MSNLPKCRIGSDCHFALTLKDSGVSVDWSTVTIRQIFMYSLAQKAWGGKCKYHIDPNDETLLKVNYPASQQMYMGDHRIVIQIAYKGNENTYDTLAVNIVPLTEDVTGDVTIDAEDIPVGIIVSDLHTSVITEILEACEIATMNANEATASADSAAMNANNAANDANNAASAANTATSNALSASLSATRAATKANEATSSANNAATSANNAADYANECGTYADNAGTRADDAASNAENATVKANNAADYAKAQGDYAFEQGAAANAAEEEARRAAIYATYCGDQAKAAAEEAKTLAPAVEKLQEKTWMIQANGDRTDINGNFKSLGKIESNGNIETPSRVIAAGVDLGAEVEELKETTSAHTSKLTDLSLKVGTNTTDIENLKNDTSKVEPLKQDIEAMKKATDNLGDVHAKSIDLDELPKVCGYPLYIFGTSAPSVTPDFAGQFYIDTTNHKIYLADGVINASSFRVLN